MNTRYKLVVHKPIQLLSELIEIFADNSHLSLEGRLNKAYFSQIFGVSWQPNDILNRNTTSPEQDFVILPINSDTKDIIVKSVLPKIGLRKNVLHVLIEKDRALVFATYDQFHPDCVWLSGQVKEEVLETLLSKKIVTYYEKVFTDN